MNNGQVKGTAKGAAGQVHEKTGEAIGSQSQKAKGMVKDAEG